MCVSCLRGNPSTNNCGFGISTVLIESRNCPAASNCAVTVTFSLFPPDVIIK